MSSKEKKIRDELFVLKKKTNHSPDVFTHDRLIFTCSALRIVHKGA